MPVYRIRDRNVLFIHVPKTGGTTVETFLSRHAGIGMHNQGIGLLKPCRESALTRSLSLQHFHAALLKAMFAPDFFDYAFMIVRDPLERLKSEYRHSAAFGRPDARLRFAAWAPLMLGLARFSPGLRNNHFRPQTQFTCFNAEIFRFEDGMNRILAALGTRLGLPGSETVPHERNLAAASFDVPPRIRARVRAAYDADYRTFGYRGENE